jgi:hypothetical protein
MKPKPEPKKKEKKLSYSLFPKQTVPVVNLGQKVNRTPFNPRLPYKDD